MAFTVAALQPSWLAELPTFLTCPQNLVLKYMDHPVRCKENEASSYDGAEIVTVNRKQCLLVITSNSSLLFRF